MKRIMVGEWRKRSQDRIIGVLSCVSRIDSSQSIPETDNNSGRSDSLLLWLLIGSLALVYAVLAVEALL